MFVGRKNELAFLETAFQSEKSEFIPIYGRRRVGKSELILKFIEHKKSIYFLGKQAPSMVQLKSFMEQASLALDDPLIERIQMDDWEEALDLCVERLTANGKAVLVLDEFQWMVEMAPDLPSVIQQMWDRKWKAGGKVILILCGSFIGFMEREVLGRKSPLFGRRTGQIHLKPFGYLEAGDFHPSWSESDKARAYFVCGGVPLYHLFFEHRRSLEKTSKSIYSASIHPCSGNLTSYCAKSCAMYKVIMLCSLPLQLERLT